MFGRAGYQGRPNCAGPYGILAPWLTKTPEIVNKDCYSSGWIVKVELSKPDELKQLLDDKAYGALFTRWYTQALGVPVISVERVAIRPSSDTSTDAVRMSDR